MITFYIMVAYYQWSRKLGNNILLVTVIHDSPYISTLTNISNKDKVSKYAYKLLVEKYVKNEHISVLKWENDLGQSICQDNWSDYFKLIYRSTCINKFKFFQYRMQYRIIVTNKNLYMWNMHGDNLCTFCNQAEENLIHLFWECPVSRNIWNKLFNWFFNRTGLRVNVTVSQVMLGIQTISDLNTLLNIICIITKQYLYSCRCLNNCPGLDTLIFKIHNCEYIERAIAKKKDKLTLHSKKWEFII